MLKFFFSLLAGLASSLLAGNAHAQAVSGWANEVGSANGLMAVFGGAKTFPAIITYVMDLILGGGASGSLIWAVGVFILVRAGLRLINSQDEDKLTTARRTIAATCVGIMLAFLAKRLVAAFFDPGGTWNAGTVNAGASILVEEVGGIINWVLTLIVVIAILMIVASGIKAIASFGKEEGAEQVRQTIYGVITGIGLIMLSGAIKLTIGLSDSIGPSLPGNPDPSAIITKGVNVVMAILNFMALGAVAVIVYAGLLMILNLGEEEQFNKAKGIIFRAVIGLVVILFSVVVITLITRIFL
jgi:hypothetical protein